MATYTPTRFDEPGGWEFTDEEKRHEADKHFAKLCGDFDLVSEAFGPDAWEKWEDRARDLGDLLNRYRHADSEEMKQMLDHELRMLIAIPAMEYIDREAVERAEDTIVDSMIWVED